MSLVLDLPPDLETELAAKAARLGLSLSEYAMRVLAGERVTTSTLRTGVNLMAYWQAEGLIGTRPEITDAAAHARALRQESQSRARE